MRNFKLDQLKAFVEVAKCGSFTAASKVLNLTQPAITHNVRELEERFQIALFERVGNHVHLTAAGQKLVELAGPLLQHDARAREMMRSFIKGWLHRVRIGTSMTVVRYVLPPVLRRLKIDHPQLEIRLRTGLTAATLQLLKDNELDLGLCAMPVKDAAFETVQLFSDELAAILPAQLPHMPKTVTPAFLSRTPLILGNKESALYRSITEWLAQAGPVPEPVMQFDNVEVIKSIVAIGLGSSIVPSLSLSKGDLASMNLVVRPISPSLHREMGLISLRGKQRTDAISTVYEALLTLRHSEKACVSSAALLRRTTAPQNRTRATLG